MKKKTIIEYLAERGIDGKRQIRKDVNDLRFGRSIFNVNFSTNFVGEGVNVIK